MKLIQRAAAGRGGVGVCACAVVGYCCSRTDREVWRWGGSICLLPLLIGTSASQTATDAEAQREKTEGGGS